MSKTIRELADELGVSKQAINRLLTSDFRRQYVTIKGTNGGKTILINKSGESLIYKHFKGGNTGQQELVATLLDQVDSQKVKLKFKDQQIANMQKLLDQSQQLQLMTESKIKQLENKNNKSETEDLSKEKPEPEKKGFWKNLFS